MTDSCRFSGMTGTTIVVIGKPETTFEIHKDLLTQVSTYFKEALVGQTEKISLPQRHTATTFNVFTQWLYRQPNSIGTTTFHVNCIDAYLLGKYLQAPVFMEVCQANIKLGIANGKLVCSSSQLEGILFGTNFGDPTRYLILNHFASKILDGECEDLRPYERISGSIWKELCTAVAVVANLRKEKNENAPKQRIGFGSGNSNISPFNTAAVQSSGAAFRGFGSNSAFGNLGNEHSLRASGFANTINQNQSSNGLFGKALTNNNSSGGFSFASVPPYAPLDSANSNAREGLFGRNLNSTTQGGHFGSVPNNQPSKVPFGDATTGGGLFGCSSTANGLTGLFGSAQGNPTSSGGLFGNTSSNTQPRDLFGSSNANSRTADDLFGNNSNNPKPASGLFGHTQPNTSGGLFGSARPTQGGLVDNSNTQTPWRGGVFGNRNTASEGLFGNPTTQAQRSCVPFGSALAPSSGSVFGNTRRPSSELGLNNRTAQATPNSGFGFLLGQYRDVHPQGSACGTTINAGADFRTPNLVTYTNSPIHGDNQGINRRPITQINNQSVAIPCTTNTTFTPVQEKDFSFGVFNSAVCYYQSLACHTDYQQFSPEELRYADYSAGISAVPNSRSLANQATSESNKEGALRELLAQIPLESQAISHVHDPAPSFAATIAAGRLTEHGSISKFLDQSCGQTEEPEKPNANQDRTSQCIKDLQVQVEELKEMLARTTIDIATRRKEEQVKVQETITSKNNEEHKREASMDIKEGEDQHRSTPAAPAIVAPGTGMSTPEIILTPTTSRAQSIEPTIATGSLTTNLFRA